jgi:rod shape-determining protein MreC
MFSKRLVTIFCLILFALINIILLSVSTKNRHGSSIVDRVVMAGIAPFQEGVMRSLAACEHVWSHYFDLITVKEECDQLKRLLAQAELDKSRCLESELAYQRLGKLLDMRNSLPARLLAAEVVGLDPSGWFKTIIINRGTRDGVSKGMPVIAPEGIVGQIVSPSYEYSKVLLIIDPSSSVDALVQRSRARGIVEGNSEQYCRFKYVVRKADVQVGDTVISSGLDRLFPKGLRMGSVQAVARSQSGIFQEVRVRPFVDFARLEEVLVMLE